MLFPEDEGSTFLQNIYETYTRLQNFKTQKTKIENTVDVLQSCPTVTVTVHGVAYHKASHTLLPLVIYSPSPSEV
jgi:hypothetical protein